MSICFSPYKIALHWMREIKHGKYGAHTHNVMFDINGSCSIVTLYYEVTDLSVRRFLLCCSDLLFEFSVWRNCNTGNNRKRIWKRNIFILLKFIIENIYYDLKLNIFFYCPSKNFPALSLFSFTHCSNGLCTFWRQSMSKIRNFFKVCQDLSMQIRNI